MTRMSRSDVIRLIWHSVWPSLVIVAAVAALYLGGSSR